MTTLRPVNFDVNPGRTRGLVVHADGTRERQAARNPPFLVKPSAFGFFLYKKSHIRFLLKRKNAGWLGGTPIFLSGGYLVIHNYVCLRISWGVKMSPFFPLIVERETGEDVATFSLNSGKGNG